MNIEEEVKSRLGKKFEQGVDRIEFYDERGDQRHFMLKICSEKFDGMSRVDRSRELFELLNDLMKNDHIHALRMDLKTPKEQNQKS